MEIGKNERLTFQTTRARKTAPPVAFGEFHQTTLSSMGPRTHVNLDSVGQGPFSGLIKVRIGINPCTFVRDNLTRDNLKIQNSSLL